MSVPGHTCQRCGASCTGSHVVPVDPAERERVRAHAEGLGVPSPFDGQALRQNMGRCCLWSPTEGCRLHGRYGAEAKPRVCRQFPFVRAGDRVAIDPACPHATASGPPPAHALRPLLGAPSERSLAVDASLPALAAHVGLDDDGLGRRWAAVPWVPWSEVAALGPHLRGALPELRELQPLHVRPWAEGARAVATCWRLQLGGSLDELVLGACAVAWAPLDRRRTLLAAWVKLVR